MSEQEKIDASQGRKPIFVLAQSFVADSHQLEKALHASLWSHPWQRAARRWSEPRLRAPSRSELRELLERYRTVMVHVLRRGELPVGQWEPVFRRLGEHVRVNVRVARDYRVFATLVWDGLTKGFRPRQDVEVLKPKFMLRQFADAMPRGGERTVLLEPAYGTKPTPEGDEWVTTLFAAYRLLHETILPYREDLEAMTGGAITADWLDGLDPLDTDSLRAYHEFLFPPDRGDDTERGV